MTPTDSPTHSTAFAPGDPHLTARLRRFTLSLGLLLVGWSTRSGAYSPAHAPDRAAAARRSHTDHETLIRRHHTHRALEQERQRAEARMLMAPLSW